MLTKNFKKYFLCRAFSPGVPVQPCFIRYKNNLDTITWSWEGPGELKQLWLTLTQFYISCELEFLPVYRPTEQEIQNPRLFADNVQHYVSSWTNTPVSDFILEDARFLTAVKEYHLPPTVALVKLLRLRRTLGNQDMDPEDELKQLEEKRKSFAPLRGDVQHLASYLGLERCPEALKEFFRILDQQKKNSLDVRVYDIGLWMLRTDVKMKEKMQKAFQILDEKSENLETIALYWKGIKSLKNLKETVRKFIAIRDTRPFKTAANKCVWENVRLLSVRKNPFDITLWKESSSFGIDATLSNEMAHFKKFYNR